MRWLMVIAPLVLAFVLLLGGAVMLAVQVGRALPVGAQIAYISKLDGLTWDIYLMDVERGVSYNASRPLMNGFTARNRLPTWSPDGRELAFVSEFNRGMDIYFLNPARNRLRNLGGTGQNKSTPAWSPPGVGVPRIAYSLFNGSTWDIYVSPVDPYGGVHLIMDGWTRPFAGWVDANDRAPAWSPDGRELMFISDWDGRDDVYITDANGRDIRRLTHHMSVESAVWSPTGTHIAVVSLRIGIRDIYLVNAQTGAFTNITRGSTDDYEPVWSPDGTRIAFTSERNGFSHIFVMNHDGGELLQLTEGFAYNYAPAWSPDGRSLAYVSVPDYFSEIYIVNADGGTPRRLTRNNVDDWSPVWRP